MKKRYIDASQLLQDSFELALKVFQSGFRPNYIVGVWRGGAPDNSNSWHLPVLNCNNCSRVWRNEPA
jgi:hypothetical protein